MSDELILEHEDGSGTHMRTCVGARTLVGTRIGMAESGAVRGTHVDQKSGLIRA